ncbi:MAG: hypothetical protein Q3M24_18295 [Candidatus Electrothrix aestuarii]|uniref:Secretin/TonB short N-terminal domain-containing protein n=1 Tax=Candidatus Electrothrix aestuarii TaxID=3062594 RepID=A0AAU8LT63_9BACT|nr:MAG: hypothetical protein SD837_13835 [Candidatus Electrothrix sp. GW3-3]
MSASKITTLGVVFFGLLITSLALGAGTAGWLDEKVNIRFQNEAMSKVLGEISQQTGVAILFDEKLASEKVTGYYKNIKFSEAINRLFNEKNKSIQVFKNEKKITVKTFGAKQFVLASADEAALGQSSDNSSDGMTLAELEKMHKQQYKEYKARIADENEVVEDGMTRAQLKKIVQKQDRQFKMSLKDDNEALEDGMTRAQLKKIVQKQDRQFKMSLKDDNEALEDGMTRAQLKKIVQQQEQQFQKALRNNEQLIDEDKTRRELQGLVRKQMM